MQHVLGVLLQGNIPVPNFFKTLIGQGDDTDSLILIDFRLPRMLITILAGAALSMSGAVVQSVTKNPIAEPGILGINAGGGFAIALFVAIGQVKPDNFVYVLPIISLVGGVATALVIFIFSVNKYSGLTPCQHGINRCRYANGIIWRLYYPDVKV